MKFLVTGSAGLVGSQVVVDLTRQNHTVYSCYNESEPTCGIPIKLDLANTESINDVINKTCPDRIIHLAAMTDVDRCETDPQLAIKINADATKALAKQAAKSNTFFVYVSTDYVFDGTKGMRKEDDITNPLSSYGKSKLAGELALQNLKLPCCIARTSTPFGLHKKKKSFPIWVKESLESKKEIEVLADQFTSPTYVPNLSTMLIEVATRQIAGVIHLAGATRISRYDMAKLVAEKLGLDQRLLKKTTMSKISWKAKRPAYSSLDVSLASALLNEKPQPITKSLELFVNEFIIK
jgi:dTDP-4-dehydrorhamnose reductase